MRHEMLFGCGKQISLTSSQKIYVSQIFTNRMNEYPAAGEDNAVCDDLYHTAATQRIVINAPAMSQLYTIHLLNT